MSLKHGLLGLLHYGSMSGYELDKFFKSSLNFFWQANRSQIYRELNKMEDEGWLTSKIVFQTEKPNKKLYTITDEGKNEFEKWLTIDCVDDALFTRNPLLLKTFFAGERGDDDNIRMLEDFKERCEKELMNIQQACRSRCEKNKDEIYWSITADYGEYYYDMCINWAKNSINKLKGEKE
ncbi:transcriptional regulator [Vallitalea longa]|uniref:Transcriptional regulator n=1 Tax=Vallitalea longa TaxID=2936439 RepID=A0A9W5YBE4_9FIRM|nr:PadR family transcriptional regulator [Vallitalea longa]GKX29273.1 transcriptional regulator [Vallitalea longa]